MRDFKNLGIILLKKISKFNSLITHFKKIKFKFKMETYLPYVLETNVS
jgi:hypothetical protein